MADTVRQGLLGMQRLFLGSRTADLEASLRDMEDRCARLRFGKERGQWLRFRGVGEREAGAVEKLVFLGQGRQISRRAWWTWRIPGAGEGVGHVVRGVWGAPLPLLGPGLFSSAARRRFSSPLSLLLCCTLHNLSFMSMRASFCNPRNPQQCCSWAAT